MAPFRHLLHDHQLWGIRRKSVVPAFSLGVFIAFLPFPAHLFEAALAALVLRVNIPVAVITTFIANPLTMGPMYYFNYRVGAALLSLQPGPFNFEFSLDWVTHTFVSIWRPMLLGSVLVGAFAALLAFLALDLLWRYSIANYKTKKKKNRDLLERRSRRN
ncbi:MAG: DUF2062 domain-containing protein [Gammaproteobacteria bacterium]|nr:DUF2062 domain-containing protein [Gammaproteobacteria bacterium]